jgi:Zn-dependent protease
MSQTTLILLAVLIPSVMLHEISHGAVALAFGDDTAKRAGRLTLNPIAHVDPFGTLILPLLLALTGAGMFGWAKPVPVNPAQLRNPRQQALLVSLAGPATNIALALLAIAILRIFYASSTTGIRFALAHGFYPTAGDTALALLLGAVTVNVILAAFNLLPIPPLDGSAVIERFLPREWAPHWYRFRQYSMGLLLIVVLMLPGALNRVFVIALRLGSRLL